MAEISTELIFMGAFIGLTFGPLIVVFLIGLLTPGRKGSMLTMRDVFHEGVTLEEAKAIYESRLEYEEFEIEQNRLQETICAKRRPYQSSNPFLRIDTHSRLPLKAKIEFEEQSGGVQVVLSVWTTESIFVDTGEGRYVDETLERLLSADLEKEAAPVVPNVAFKCSVAFCTGIMMVLCPILALSLGFTVNQYGAIFPGMFIGIVCCVVLALLGIRDCVMKPKEAKGIGRAIAGIVLGFAGLAIGGIGLVVNHML